MPPRSVAVVGAGIAGLACAVALSDAGVVVTVFDKGRQPGGRVATRRIDGVSFDHGAQFAAARGAGFSAAIAEMASGGMAAPWRAAGGDGTTRFVGVPGMWTIPSCMASWLHAPSQQQRHVAWLERKRGWRLRHHASAAVAPGTVTPEGGTLEGPFDAVVVALPAPQAAALLAEAAPDLAAQAARAVYGPCWTMMARFNQRLDLPDTRRATDGPIGWLARESSRPGRAAAPERFVVQASAAWSRDHLEDNEEAVTAALIAALADLAPLPAVIAAAHRWRYALVEQALGTDCLWDADRRLGACGDWCLGGRIEAAWDSGHALAAAILADDQA